MEGSKLHIELKRNPGWPTPEESRRRFDKPLEESPWAGDVEATIYLDDPIWELLGYPEELTATIEGVKR